jgi:hypothetical protein
VSTGSSPVVPYWHVWTNNHGISHQSRCELGEFHKAAIQPAAAPQWIGVQTRHDATVFVAVLPVGWIGDWHENPRPQWMVPLSGRWFVESMDGIRIEIGPGEISFGEDPNTRQVDGKRGHLSGTLVLMLVQFEVLPTIASACRFRSHGWFWTFALNALRAIS